MRPLMPSEAIGSVRTLQAFTSEKPVTNRFAQAVDRAFEAARQATLSRAVLTAIAIFLVFASVVIVLWVGAQDVLAGQISAGRLSQFILYAVFAAGGLGELSQVWGEISQASGAAERLFEILEVEPQVKAPAKPVALPVPARGEVAFENVRFFYPARPEMPALDQRVAACAAGREGRDRRPLRRGKKHDLPSDPALLRSDLRAHHASTACASPMPIRRNCAHRIALVPQETAIFATSIRENIGFGRPDASIRADRARRRDGGGGRIHPPLAAGLRHADRRARHHALRRPAPAHRDRARDPARCAASPAR